MIHLPSSEYDYFSDDAGYVGDSEDFDNTEKTQTRKTSRKFTKFKEMYDVLDQHLEEFYQFEEKESKCLECPQKATIFCRDCWKFCCAVTILYIFVF